jgi:signal transduction histidine kinase
MRISEFIRKNEGLIIREWEDFARHCPQAAQMDADELRDNISGLLRFIVGEMDDPRSASAEDDHADAWHKACGSPAEEHAEQRFIKGFDTLEMMLEFRALRRNTVRHWLEQLDSVSMRELEDLRRFNAVIDWILAESVTRYMDKQKNARGLFLGMLVHDIRSPLSAIAQAARLLQLLGGLGGKQEQLTLQIQRSARRIEDLVSQLIDAVRLRLDKALPISREPMDMREAARQVVEELQTAHPRRRIVLDAPSPVAGEWDRTRIGQVLSNLLSNAVQHGEPDAAITVALRQGQDDVTLTVHNTGRPILPADLPTIFDPLTRGLGRFQRDQDKMSLGLGLFIAREIAVAHGGDINVASSIGQGTTFTIRLPRFVVQAFPEGDFQQRGESRAEL